MSQLLKVTLTLLILQFMTATHLCYDFNDIEFSEYLSKTAFSSRLN